MLAETKTEHPHIVQRETLAGIEPHVRGTNIAVRHVVGHYRQYGTIEGVLNACPHLTAAQVHDALSFYYDHSAEIDGRMQDHAEETWQARDLPAVWRQKSQG